MLNRSPYFLLFGVYALTAVTMSSLAVAEHERPAEGSKTLAMREISKGQELVVLEGPFVPIAAIKNLVAPEMLDVPKDEEPVAGFTWISVELRLDAGPGLRLFSLAKKR